MPARTLAFALVLLCGACSKSFDGEQRHYEPKAGFSIVPPKGWQIERQDGGDLPMFMNFTKPPAGLNFKRDLKAADLATLVLYTIKRSEQLNPLSRMVTESDFETTSGMKGKRLVFEVPWSDGKLPALRQIFYLFVEGSDTHVIWGSVPAVHGTGLDRELDEAAKSYRTESLIVSERSSN
jgi:hypothetical protein